MEHTTTVHTEHKDSGTKEIWRTFWYLLIITIVELGIGFYMYKAAIPQGGYRSFLKGAIVILMLWKAFYIVAYFMHLKHEIKNLIMTIVVPLTLFIWFIIAFLADGNSYRNLRNTFDPHHKEQSITPAPVKEGHGHGHEHTPGAMKPGEME